MALQRDQSDYQIQYDKVRSGNEASIELYKEAVALKTQQRIADIRAFTAYRLTAETDAQIQPNGELQGEKVDRVEIERAHGKGLHLIEYNFTTSEANTQEWLVDGKAYNTWVYDYAVAIANVGNSTSDQYMKDVALRTVDQDNALSLQSAEKAHAANLRNRQIGSSQETARNDQAITANYLKWGRVAIAAYQTYEVAVANNDYAFSSGYLPLYSSYSDALTLSDESMTEALHGNAKNIAGVASQYQVVRNDADAHSETTYQTAMAGRATAVIHAWNLSLGTLWSSFKDQMATFDLDYLLGSAEAKESFITENQAAILEEVLGKNSSTKQMADKYAEGVADNESDETDAVTTYSTGLSNARLAFALEMAGIGFANSEETLGADVNAANLQANHWLTRNVSAAEARFTFNSSQADAAKSLLYSRAVDGYDLRQNVINQAAYETRRITAFQAWDTAIHTAEGVRRTTLATSEMERAVADSQLLKDWISDRDGIDVFFAYESRDAAIDFADAWKALSIGLSVADANSIADFENAINKAQRDNVVATASAETELEKDERLASIHLAEKMDDANDALRLDGDASRGEYEFGLVNEHKTKLVTAGVTVSGPLARHNLYEQNAAQSDIEFKHAAKVAQDEFNLALSLGNGEGNEVYDDTDQLDDLLERETELANAREAIADLLAGRNRDRQVTEDTATIMSYRASLVLDLTYDAEKLQIERAYDVALATAGLTYVSTAAGAEKLFYLAQPYVAADSTFFFSSAISESVAVSVATPSSSPIGLEAMRLAKQNAANAYAISELNAKEDRLASLGDATVGYLQGLKQAVIARAESIAAAENGFFNGTKLDRVLGATNETAIEVPHHTAQRGYSQAQASYDKGVRSTQNLATRSARDTYDQELNVARVARSGSIGQAVGTLFASLAQDNATQVNSGIGSTNLAIRNEAATADAISSWTSAMASTYANYVQSITQAAAVLDNSLRSARHAQEDASQIADDAYHAAAQPLEDAADDERFAAARQFVEDEEEAEGAEDIANSVAQGAYEVATAGVDYDELIANVQASLVTALESLVKAVYVGPFVNVLDFSDEGTVISAAIPSGPESGSDGYPVTGSGGSPAAESPPSNLEHQEAVANAEATLVKEQALSVAGNARSVALADAKNVRSHQRATDFYDMRVVIEGIDRDLAKDLAPLEEVRQNAYSQAQNTYWSASVAAKNQQRSSNLVADNAWQTASYSAKASATHNYSQAMQLPWASYLADRSDAENTWWQAYGAAQAGAVVSGKNAADTAYQLATNNAYTLWSQATNAAEKAHTIALADINYQRAIDELVADKNLDWYVADGDEAWAVALSNAKSAYEIANATASRDLVVSGNAAASESAHNQAESALHLSVFTANVNHDRSLAVAQGGRELAYQAHLNARNAAKDAAEYTYVVAQNTATLANAQAISVAYIALTRAYYTLDVNQEIQRSVTLSGELADLAQQHPSPWAAQDSATETAHSTLLQAIGPAFIEYVVSVVGSDENLDDAITAAKNTLNESWLEATQVQHDHRDVAAYALAGSVQTQDNPNGVPITVAPIDEAYRLGHRSAGGGNYELKDVLGAYVLIYGPDEPFLRLYLKAGHGIGLGDVSGDRKLTGFWSKNWTIWIEEDMRTSADAAALLHEELEVAFAWDKSLQAEFLNEVAPGSQNDYFTIIDRELKLKELRLKTAAATVGAILDKLTLAASIINEGADLAITFNELSEGNWTAALGLIPLVPGSFWAAGGKLVMKWKVASGTVDIAADFLYYLGQKGVSAAQLRAYLNNGYDVAAIARKLDELGNASKLDEYFDAQRRALNPPTPPVSVVTPPPSVIGPVTPPPASVGKAIDPPNVLPHKLTSSWGSCFVAGTLVLTPRGEIPIEALRVGDLVFSKSETDPQGGVVSRTVEKVFRLSGQIAELHVQGQIIETTQEHPFYVEGAGWKHCKDLLPGERLMAYSGEAVVVEKVVVSERIEPVYNIAVAEDHTYFVGSLESWGFAVWVHNQYALIRLDDGKWAFKNLDTGEIVATKLGNKVIDDYDSLVKYARDNKIEFVAPNGKYRGGLHGSTKGPVGDGLDSHHMPAKSVNGLHSDKGPAIQMDPADHALTASHGTQPGSDIYRLRQQRLIKQGKFGEAIQMDIDNVRKLFGNKYDEAIREMIDELEPWMKKGISG